MKKSRNDLILILTLLILLAGGILVFFRLSADRFTVTVLDVGKGDAFVIRCGNDVTLIDTASDKKGDTVVTYLRKQGIRRIDTLIISHFDKDHVGGADRVLRTFHVDRIYTAACKKDSEQVDEFYAVLEAQGMEAAEVTDTLTYEAGGATYTIYPPMQVQYEKKDSNNSSLAVMVERDGKRAFFTGDAQKERIEELLALSDISCDLLKVPHHGKIEDNTGALIEACHPVYAVITSSDTEPEDAEVIRILEEAGAEVVLTRDGEVTFDLNLKGSTGVSR